MYCQGLALFQVRSPSLHSMQERSIVKAKWSTTGMERGTPAIICTSQRTKGWKRYSRSIASRVSIPGKCCTVDHIDHRFKIVPATSHYSFFKPSSLTSSAAEASREIFRDARADDATANEPSNAASKNGASLPNTTLPTEMRTWLPGFANSGKSTHPTSRCCQLYGVKDGMLKSASLLS